MPATEAETEDIQLENEPVAYELAFHVLPTVAEGEVPATFEQLKEHITNAGAIITDEEAPQRFELAYEIEKAVDGVNRKFTSAYFGWVRFSALPTAIAEVNELVESHPSLLRHLLIRLTRVEEEHPFRFHEALAADKQISTVEEHEVTDSAETTTTDSEEATAETSESDDTEDTKDKPVDDEALEKALTEKSA